MAVNHKVVENPRVAIVYFRGFGPMEILRFEDFEAQASLIGFGNPRFCGFTCQIQFSSTISIGRHRYQCEILIDESLLQG